MVNAMVRKLAALHRDERGADMVEYILMIAAVSLPLLAVIIWFWKDISAWAGELYQEARSRGPGDPGQDPSDLGHK